MNEILQITTNLPDTQSSWPSNSLIRSAGVIVTGFYADVGFLCRCLLLGKMRGTDLFRARTDAVGVLRAETIVRTLLCLLDVYVGTADCERPLA